MDMYLLRFLLIIVAFAFTCVEQVALQRISKRGSNFLKHLKNIKRRDLNDISEVSANSCKNVINDSTIIRANESIANGAIYIKVLEGQTQQQCINSCCSTVNCTLAVYENKNANDCFLFNCGYPSKCYFSHYDFYKSINFQMSSVQHKLGTSIKTHEDELATLHRKTTKQPTTIAPTTMPPLPVALFAHCDPKDTCSDTHASCLEGRCACEAGYQAKYGKCQTLAKQAPTKNVSKEQEGGVKRPMLPSTHTQPLPNNQNANQGNRQRPYHPIPDQIHPYHPIPDQIHPYHPIPDQKQPYQQTSKQSRPLQNTKTIPQPPRELQPSINNKEPDGSESGQVSSGAKSDNGQEQVNQELDGGPVEGEKVTGGKKGGKTVDAGEKFPGKVDADADTGVKEEDGGKVDGAGLKEGRKSSVVIIKKKEEESEWSLTPIIVLALGLAITGVLLTFVACRLRTVKRRIRKGRPLHSHEADYLINGMYL